jgi:hypothetical protein
MTGPHDQPDYIDPSVPEAARPELQETARLLEDSRPVPSPAFRGTLRRSLVRRQGSFTRSAQVHARRTVLAYGGSGLVLLVVAAAGLAGIGPLGA